MKRREVVVTPDGLYHAVYHYTGGLSCTLCGWDTWIRYDGKYRVLKSAKPITCLECLAGDASTIREGLFDDVDE